MTNKVELLNSNILLKALCLTILLELKIVALGLHLFTDEKGQTSHQSWDPVNIPADSTACMFACKRMHTHKCC